MSRDVTTEEKEYCKATVIIWREDKWFVAYEPLTSVASQGKTLEEALNNIKEALELYLEETKEEIYPLERVMITTVDVRIPKKVVTA